MADGNKGWENVKGHSFADMDPEKQKRIATMGGEASGEARRKKKLMREQMETLLSLDVIDPQARMTMEVVGIDPEDMTNQMALIMALFKAGLSGDVKAFVAIRDTVGEMPVATQNLNINPNPFAGLSTEELRKLVNDD